MTSDTGTIVSCLFECSQKTDFLRVLVWLAFETQDNGLDQEGLAGIRSQTHRNKS